MALTELTVRIAFALVCFSQASAEYCSGTYSSFNCPEYSGGPKECCHDNTIYNYCCYWDDDSSWDDGYDDVYHWSVGAIVGIAIGSLALLGFFIAIIVALCCCCAGSARAKARRPGPTTVTHIQGGIPMTAYPPGQQAYPGGQQVAPGQPPYPGQQTYVGQFQAYPAHPQGYPGHPQGYPAQPPAYEQPPPGQYPGGLGVGPYNPPSSATAGQHQQPTAPGEVS